MTADWDGLVDEVSVELDVVLVELEEADVELDDVEDDSLVFSTDFSITLLVSVDEGGETVVDLSEYTPIITDIRIINITATPIKYGINFFTFNSYSNLLTSMVYTLLLCTTLLLNACITIN